MTLGHAPSQSKILLKTPFPSKDKTMLLGSTDETDVYKRLNKKITND